MSSGTNGTKRPYDARRRRERAEEERQATQSRVIEAAIRLFSAKGYKGTTMADIAAEAGVAIQSVYTAGRSKADLLQAAVQRSVAGDDQEVLVHQRPPFLALAAETDPELQVRLAASLICDIQERSEPMQAAQREAAALDPVVAAGLVAAHRKRRETVRALIGMVPEERLRSSPEASTDTAWAVASAEVFLLLRRVQEWSWDQIREWLARTLVDLLLLPET